MKTTIELPDELLRQAKVTAVNRGTSLRKLVIEGLKSVLAEADASGVVREAPVERLRRGYHLGGKPLSRKGVHER